MGKLWYGGKIYTMRQEGEVVEAVYTDNGRVIDLGTKSYLEKAYANQIDDEHDLDGQVMYPGFIDSHLHIIGHGERILRLDLTYIKSPEELLRAVKDATQKLSPGEWLIGEGFNENQWENPRIIHRNELDEACAEHPVMLTRVCRHAIIANTKAMNEAGITNDVEAPSGGVIDKDEKGEMTGFFLDNAQDLIKNHVPEVSISYLEKAVTVAIQDLVQHGIVSGHSEDLNYYGGFERTYEAFARSIDGVNLKFRAHLLVHNEVIEDMDKSGHQFKNGSDWLELGAMKIFADGAFGGRTAWLKEPYADASDQYGVQINSIDHMKKLMVKARSRSMPVAVHAIGDQAAEMVLNMIEQYPPAEGVRDRLIHAQLVNPNLINRMRKLSSLAVDIQPTFVASDFPWVLERIGEERQHLAYAWKSLMDAGIVCAGGSDAPIEEIDPIKGIAAAVNRTSYLDGKTYGEAQCLSPYEAVSLYTTGAAYASGNEEKQGQIAPGFYADFTVLDQDLFDIPKENIIKTNVMKTIVDEEIVYVKND
ncbi:amidohydrolase [Salinibacillus xinjiangensis]|uniref:Amidohydrolase family protein n=1 Tax=Salinibacillus xinjiangensis TaxID=1229268 RepID=A0A6G1X9L7_9BACI|nr:amidohydrolase [Salinibacillus xinjiangensis]MRG87711.1 amidohydrolase family protein [Salinibacillus xinjiangensis]